MPFDASQVAHLGLQSAPAYVLFLKLHGHPACSYRQPAGERFTLSWGRGPGWGRAFFL